LTPTAAVQVSTQGSLSQTATPQSVTNTPCIQEVPYIIPDLVKKSKLIGEVEPDKWFYLVFGLPLRNSLTAAQGQSQRTTGEFEAKFSPTLDDFQALVKYCIDNGFSIASKHPLVGGLSVSGTAATINNALHFRLLFYSEPGGRKFFAPDKAPCLDFEIKVQHIGGLDNACPPRSVGSGHRPRDLKPK
jgi:hypothetical protein